MSLVSHPTQTPYLRLREARAPKLGARAIGGIRYAVLADPERGQLFVTILTNEGSGHFSKEVVPLRDIEEALAGFAERAPFPSRALASAYVGKSSCNAGFLAAVLRAEGLIAPMSADSRQLVRCGDWERWQRALLAIEGDPVLIPPKVPAPPSRMPAVPVAVPAEPSPAAASTQRARRSVRRAAPQETSSSEPTGCEPEGGAHEDHS